MELKIRSSRSNPGCHIKRSNHRFNYFIWVLNVIKNKEDKMKNIFVLIFFVLISVENFSNVTPVEKRIDKNQIEINLINGLQSGNSGLMVSSALFLGDIGSNASVIPLMTLLKNEKNEKVRVAAALALIKIGDGRGIFAVSQAAKFDDSEYVRRMCAILSSKN
jgi:HEAT repeat protein